MRLKNRGIRFGQANRTSLQGYLDVNEALLQKPPVGGWLLGRALTVRPDTVLPPPVPRTLQLGAEGLGWVVCARVELCTLSLPDSHNKLSH